MCVFLSSFSFSTNPNKTLKRIHGYDFNNLIHRCDDICINCPDELNLDPQMNI